MPVLPSYRKQSIDLQINWLVSTWGQHCHLMRYSKILLEKLMILWFFREGSVTANMTLSFLQGSKDPLMKLRAEVKTGDFDGLSVDPDSLKTGRLRVCLSLSIKCGSCFLFKSFVWLELIFKRSCPKVFCKKGILRNFAKVAGKELCQSLFLIKLQAEASKFIRKETVTGVFLWILRNF